ncbi:hypothetical protein ERJ75_001587100 [Trypanosoma vivax]|nr:hypothetical protein ERJ75_001587100 [Trypanosoma vivax]
MDNEQAKNTVEELCDEKQRALEDRLARHCSEAERLVQQMHSTLDEFSLRDHCDGTRHADIEQVLTKDAQAFDSAVEGIIKRGGIVEEAAKISLQCEENLEKLPSKKNEYLRSVEAAIANVKRVADTVNEATGAKSAVDFAKEVHDVLETMCVSVRDLQDPKKNSTTFKGRAEKLATIVSTEYKNARLKWEENSNGYEMHPEAEDVSTSASKSIALLRKHLTSADETYAEVVSELGRAAKRAGVENGMRYAEAWHLVRNITFAVENSSHPDVCNEERVSQLAWSLRRLHIQQELKNVHGNVTLRTLAERVKEQMKVAASHMKKVVSVLDRARIALRRAREWANERDCIPSHAQLLSALQDIW